jgi:hypothetical protein
MPYQIAKGRLLSQGLSFAATKVASSRNIPRRIKNDVRSSDNLKFESESQVQMLTASLKFEVVVLMQVAGRLWRAKRGRLIMLEICRRQRWKVQYE